jgi:predicted permease
MFKNYWRTALRNFTRNKTYSFINILGLSVSLTASTLLFLWVWDELSFDRFHKQAERTYVAAAAFDKDKKNVWTATPGPLATFAKQEVPAVENACRVASYGDHLVEVNNKKFTETKNAYVDPSFFSIFNFPLLEGNKEKPFTDKYSVVISESMAKKYFGDEKAIGRVIKLDNKDNFTVTGIVQDMPYNSSMRYDMILPFILLYDNYDGKGYWKSLESDWGNYNYNTFFLLRPGSDPAKVGKQLADIHRRNQQEASNKDLFYLLQPLTQMHLYSVTGEDNGIQTVRVFFIVALVILLIACINYVNLVTARATKRMKEVSVRKVIGAGRGSLFWQFIIESTLVFSIALFLAIGLIFLTMPLYNDLSGKNLSFSLFDSKVLTLFGASFIAILVLAGVYPALTLSSFKPIAALKGMSPGLGKNATFRKTLVVVQFVCSVVLIVSTVIIGKQLNYIRQKNLGYDKENIFSFNTRNFKDHYEAIKTELEKQPGIKGVTAATGMVMSVGSSTSDIDWDGKGADQSSFIVNQLSTDRNFLKVLNMKLVAGQGFTGTPADSTNYILNETAVKQMHLTDPVGKRLKFHDKEGVIAGVVKDFHFNNLKNEIAPIVIFFNPGWTWWQIYVKTTAKDADKAIAAVQKLWKQYNADYDFNYKFLDEDFDNMYKQDKRVGVLFHCFALIAIIISCLGLFGLVTYTAETKVKEIGIRKTLGASAQHIILLLSKSFMKLVLLSFVISFPLAWIMMNKWLTNYAYRTQIEWWIFAIAGICAFLIAFLTVSSKAWAAAKSNPVKSLRTE